MVQAGTTLMSLRGDGPWKGATTLTLGDRGERRQKLMLNGYVTSDGSEFRTIPGWKCVADLVSGGRSNGFQANIIDAKRPATGTSGAYQILTPEASMTESMYVWAPETNLHCVEIIRGRTIIVGETSFRREPIFGSGSIERTVESWTKSGASTILTLNSGFFDGPSDYAPDGQFNSCSPDGGAVTSPSLSTIPSYVYIESITGATGDTALLAGKVHEVTLTNGGTGEITISTTVAASGTFTSSATISRVRPKLGATYPTTPTLGIDDAESLTSFVIPYTLDVDDVIVDCDVAHVANRIRDFGDAVGNTVEGYAQDQWESRRRSKEIPYRLSPDIAGNRLILAAPGYGCVFQIPVVLPVDPDGGSKGIDYKTNDIYDRPRSLGVPKAVMYVDTTTSGSCYHVVTGTWTAGAGVYKISVCYKDEGTGEVGLPSEPVTITLGGSQAPRIAIIYPGYLMGETAAVTILVYRTKVGGETFYYHETINPMLSILGSSSQNGKYGLFVQDGLSAGSDTRHQDYWVVKTLTDIIDTALDESLTIDPLPQMPMGCKAARTIRGSTFFGGYLGNSGLRNELLEGIARMQFVTGGAASAHPDVDTLENALSLNPNGSDYSPEPIDGTWGCASGLIPPAYQGQYLTSLEAFPYPISTVLLNKMVNAKAQYVVGTLTFPYMVGSWPRWKFTPTSVRAASSWTGIKPAWLQLPRGKYQVSLAGKPWITPATQTLNADTEKEDDIEGIGRLQGSAVLATRSSTYVVNWGDDPSVNSATIISDDYGCIASNSMVEYEGGCAFLSDKGPVSVGSGVDWIGQDMQQHFMGQTSRYKRDSTGMMRHAWGCHDPERSLIFFGMFANLNEGEADEVTVTYRGTSYTWDTASDEAKSRFPCDEILVFNYRARAWSVWRPPTGLEVQWMTRGLDATGTPRMFFLGADKRIYAMDDAWGQWNKDPLECVITDYDTDTFEVTTSTTFNDTVTAIGDGTFIAVGMSVMFTDTTEKVFKGFGTVVSYDTAAKTFIVDADYAMSLIATDKAFLGSRSMQLTTNHINPTYHSKASTARGINLRYSLWSMLSSGVSGSPQLPVFVRAKDTVNKRFSSVDDDPISTTVNLSSDTASTDFDYLGYSHSQTNMRSAALRRALASGQEHEFNFEFVGASQIRLHDMTLEMP